MRVNVKGRTYMLWATYRQSRIKHIVKTNRPKIALCIKDWMIIWLCI